MEFFHQRLGSHTSVRDLIELSLENSLQHDPYEDDLQSAKTFLISDKESEETPEWGYHYVDAEILLPRGYKMVIDCVEYQKQDADGNPMGTSSQNSVLDAYLYEIEFPRSKITELSANIIAKSMYTLCDIYCNDQLLLALFVNH